MCDTVHAVSPGVYQQTTAAWQCQQSCQFNASYFNSLFPQTTHWRINKCCLLSLSKNWTWKYAQMPWLAVWKSSCYWWTQSKIQPPGTLISLSYLPMQPIKRWSCLILSYSCWKRFQEKSKICIWNIVSHIWEPLTFTLQTPIWWSGIYFQCECIST